MQRNGAEGHFRHRRVDLAGGQFVPPHQAQDLAPPRGGNCGQQYRVGGSQFGEHVYILV